MMFEDKIFQPYYVKANKGLNLGFIISVFLCSNIKSIERQLIYIFYMGNIIPHDLLKNNSEQVDKKYLANIIFTLAGEKKHISKKELRKLTGLEDRGTFNKYFGDFISSIGLSKNRAFTLYETFVILNFWQGDEKWGRMEAFRKGELAKRFMNDNYDELELKMTNEIFECNEYLHHDFIKPADTKKFINTTLDKESLKLIYEEDFDLDYLNFIFFLYLLITIDNEKKKLKPEVTT